MSPLAPHPVRFGRAACGAPPSGAAPSGAAATAGAATRDGLEWLVTNGIGGFASGTVPGIRTRRYHGLLVAALAPPAQRTVMATDVHTSLQLAGREIGLHASHWRGDVVDPRGFDHLEAFWLEGRTPVWRFCVGAICVEQRLTMMPGRNVTVLQSRLVRAPSPVRLTAKVLATHRDFHATTRATDTDLTATAEGGAVVVAAPAHDAALRIASDAMTLTPADAWYEGFLLARERERGLDHFDDALHAATATVDLAPGDAAHLVLSADADPVDPAEAFQQAAAADAAVVARFEAHQGRSADSFGARLALAADQFLVERPVDGRPGTSVIAGYPWFGDWGRDTMVALPGLTLCTGRPDVARELLTTYAHFVDGGMLPNRFPDEDGDPAYNTVDATLWFLEAVRAYVQASDDLDLARELWPVLEAIVDAHERGTRYGIGVDPADGLLRAGELGVQLTWMDAKVGDWVVTPRQGKCVEVNALWFNGLVALAGLAERLGLDPAPWTARAERVRAGMQRFWDRERAHLMDVLDGPTGNDPSLRPNQILAVSLPASAFGVGRQRAIVDACERSLLTSHGLRSLAPEHPDYHGHYGGDASARDGAYHQGTAWGWLLGPFALAHERVHGDARVARSFLEPFRDHLRAHGVGSIAEIFDGDAPHGPRGCPAQAWSVAETLRAWTELAEAPQHHDAIMSPEGGCHG
ncbi:MAG: amylo-alpha-1,6-glucosidase [Trueperaceae bacterium]|nr:amylo-alpha-1,6-glucosidase [Trueperaceae bacterium]